MIQQSVYEYTKSDFLNHCQMVQSALYSTDAPDNQSQVVLTWQLALQKFKRFKIIGVVDVFH